MVLLAHIFILSGSQARYGNEAAPVFERSTGRSPDPFGTECVDRVCSWNCHPIAVDSQVPLADGSKRLTPGIPCPPHTPLYLGRHPVSLVSCGRPARKEDHIVLALESARRRVSFSDGIAVQRT